VPSLNAILRWSQLPDVLQRPSDRRMLEAARRTPCLSEGDAVIGGVTANLTFELVPAASYDVQLRAPRIDGSDPCVIAQSTLRTSRYASSAALFAALGFTPAGGAPAPAAAPPLEVMLGAELALTQAREIALGSDVLLQRALALLGMDPWPRPKLPRAVVVWQGSGANYGVAGVLLEADEPIDRKPTYDGAGDLLGRPRLTVVSATLAGVELRKVRTDAAGTRILLLANAAVALREAAQLALQVTAIEWRNGQPVEESWQMVRTLSPAPRAFEEA
jgi:hypothetical protein